MGGRKAVSYNNFFDQGATLNPDFLERGEVTYELDVPMLNYPEKNVMLEFLAQKVAWEAENGMDMPIHKINLKELAKFGKVKADKMDDYLKSDNLPSSGLKTVLRNPASFFFYLNDRKIIYEPEKPHFALGSFAHSAFLEPALFKKVKASPKVVLSKLEDCKILANFYLRLNKKKKMLFTDSKIQEIREVIEKEKALCKYMIIDPDHKIVVDIISRNYQFYAGGIIPMLLKGALKEVSFYGSDKETGLKVKVRPDAFNVLENIGVNAIISLKTTSAPTLEKFVNDTARHMYELSEGMYQEVVSDVTGRKFNVTIMIMLQTVAPFLPAVFWWSPEDLQNGKYKYRYALSLAKDCLEKQKFPGFESHAESGNFGIIDLKQPQWASKVLEPMEIEE